MTIREMMESNEVFLTPEDIAEVVGSNPQTIRLTVREYPERFAQYCPFWTGNRLKFPRLRFLWCLTGGEKM